MKFLSFSKKLFNFIKLNGGIFILLRKLLYVLLSEGFKSPRIQNVIKRAWLELTKTNASQNRAFHQVDVQKVSSSNQNSRVESELLSVENSSVGYINVKSHAFSDEADVVILVLYSANGMLSDLQMLQVEEYLSAGFEVALVVNSPFWFAMQHYVEGLINAPSVKFIMIRDNVGYDFGAWSHVLSLTTAFGHAKTVSFTNDSVIVVDQKKLNNLRKALHSTNGVMFLTQNYEIIKHSQSYFFTCSAPYFDSVKNVIEKIPNYKDKNKLIELVELKLASLFVSEQIPIFHIYNLPKAVKEIKNPTIHFWEELIDLGFPFFKLQAIISKNVDVGNDKLKKLLGASSLLKVQKHIEVRQGIINNPSHSVCTPLTTSFDSAKKYNAYGAMNAYTISEAFYDSIELPINNIADEPTDLDKILLIYHGYHIDVTLRNLHALSDAVSYFGNSQKLNLVVTTDDQEKEMTIKQYIRHEKLNFNLISVMILENRGRDIAPFLIAASTYGVDYEFLIHAHSKKSLHDENLSDWGDYCFSNLLGDYLTIKSIMAIFANEHVGMVYPAHAKSVSGVINWGFDYTKATLLLKRMNIQIDSDVPLEFPSGSMFYARTKALKPLLDLRLQSSDFDVERGQVDGTLAHAVERCLLYIVEHGGYRYERVVASGQKHENFGQVWAMDRKFVESWCRRLRPKLHYMRKSTYMYEQSVPEIYDVSVANSIQERRRFNIIVPTVQPEKIFGGVSTALKTALSIWRELEETDLRIIITSDIVDSKGLKEVSNRLGDAVTLCRPDGDGEGSYVTSTAFKREVSLSLREKDIFFATAWWTADLGYRLLDAQKDHFGHHDKLIYLIQDYEPGFYKWDSKYVAAENTYLKGDTTIPLINSEELSQFFKTRYDFQNAFCVPYKIDESIFENLSACAKEKIIIVYGRPSVSRNAFDLILEGIRKWQTRHPRIALEWKIMMVGEQFDKNLASELLNTSILGKLSLQDYATLLSKAAVGISMMISPHPSYPPLEMATAGVRTITNKFENKDLRNRSNLIVNIPAINPDELAFSIEKAVDDFVPNSKYQPMKTKPLQAPFPLFDPNSVLNSLVSHFNNNKKEEH